MQDLILRLLPLIVDKTIDIVVGILAGILTAGILVLATYLIKKILIPWYQTVVYRGIIITGTWHAVLDPKVTSADRRIENDMKVTQKGHIVRGVMTKRTTKHSNGKGTIGSVYHGGATP